MTEKNSSNVSSAVETLLEELQPEIDFVNWESWHRRPACGSRLWAPPVKSARQNQWSTGETPVPRKWPTRAELDGLVAHLYGLTEDEFAHILTTFPLVAQETKAAALEAFCDMAEGRTARR